MAGQDQSELFHFDERLVSRLIFETFGDQRYTQDSPIMPDVWARFVRSPRANADLLLTPQAGDSPSQLATVLCVRLAKFGERDEQEVHLREMVDAEMLRKLANPSETGAASLRAEFNVAYSRSSVVAEVTFEQLVCVIVPMTAWWYNLGGSVQDPRQLSELVRKGATLSQLIHQPTLICNCSSWDFLRFCALVGVIIQAQSAEQEIAERGIKVGSPDYMQWKENLEHMMEALSTGETQTGRVAKIIDGYVQMAGKALPYLESNAEEYSPKVVTENRTAQLSVRHSRSTIKADAANTLFQIDTSDFAWAMIDGGIDAQHPAFIDRRAAEKRVAKEIAARSKNHNRNSKSSAENPRRYGGRTFRLRTCPRFPACARPMTLPICAACWRSRICRRRRRVDLRRNWPPTFASAIKPSSITCASEPSRRGKSIGTWWLRSFASRMTRITKNP